MNHEDKGHKDMDQKDMDCKYIEVQITDHIATVSLNRVKSLNAINLQFAEEITRVFRKLDIMDEIWVVILKSNARIFSAGLDLKQMASFAGNKDIGSLFKMPVSDRYIFECCHAIDECRKPVIAAVHGKCVGFGLDIAAACDLVLCSEDALFSLREARVGIVADVGALQRLPHIIGLANTKHMAYTARFFSASEVERMGLVLEICPDAGALLERAGSLASEIVKSAPLAVQNTKEVINYGRNASIKDGISLAVHKNLLLFSSEDCIESFAAFIEKRNPVFKGK
jgi:enoyl-CoA hydratase